MNSRIPGSSSPLLLPAFDSQDEAFSAAFGILRDAIAQRAFPAASVSVIHQGRLVALKAFGDFVYAADEDRDKEKPKGAPSKLGLGGAFAVTPATLFDLASVTKVVATTPTAMLLYERGLLDLDAPAVAITPEFVTTAAEKAAKKDSRRRDVTLRMLLAHSSGLPAYEKLFLKAHTRDELFRAAFAVPLSADPGSRAEYSDIGFIILGVALERLAGESLDRFCQREIFGPLGMTHTTFNPPPGIRPQIPPTTDECGADTPVRQKPQSPPMPSVSQCAASTFRHRVIQGEVQDENAFVLGGVAGHAGLFSTAEDIAKFAHAMLHGGSPILRPETVGLFTRRQTAPPNTSRALGWDTPSAPSQSGKRFSPGSYGHLGYTGTSLWIDPSRQLSITLLTNRTWPDGTNQAIKQVRPKFHDAVLEAVDRL